MDEAKLLFNVNDTITPPEPNPNSISWDTVHTFDVAYEDPDLIEIPPFQAASSIARHVAVFDEFPNGVTLREVTITGFLESGMYDSNYCFDR